MARWDRLPRTKGLNSPDTLRAGGSMSRDGTSAANPLGVARHPRDSPHAIPHPPRGPDPHGRCRVPVRPRPLGQSPGPLLRVHVTRPAVIDPARLLRVVGSCALPSTPWCVVADSFPVDRGSRFGRRFGLVVLVGAAAVGVAAALKWGNHLFNYYFMGL